MRCLEVLNLQCGHRRLPKKDPIFGVDLITHLNGTLIVIIFSVIFIHDLEIHIKMHSAYLIFIRVAETLQI